MTDEKKQYYCPHCGDKILSGMLKCRICGLDLEKEGYLAINPIEKEKSSKEQKILISDLISKFKNDLLFVDLIFIWANNNSSNRVYTSKGYYPSMGISALRYLLEIKYDKSSAEASIIVDKFKILMEKYEIDPDNEFDFYKNDVTSFILTNFKGKYQEVFWKNWKKIERKQKKAILVFLDQYIELTNGINWFSLDHYPEDFTEDQYLKLNQHKIKLNHTEIFETTFLKFLLKMGVIYNLDWTTTGRNHYFAFIGSPWIQDLHKEIKRKVFPLKNLLFKKKLNQKRSEIEKLDDLIEDKTKK